VINTIKKFVGLAKSNLYYFIGYLFIKLNRLENAEKQLRKTIKINPNDKVAHITLGDLLAGLSRFEEAEKEYREALRLNPNETYVHINLGVLLSKTDRV